MTSAWSSWRPESAHAHETAWHEDDFAIGNRHATAQWAPARRDRAVHVGWAGHHRRMAHLLPWIPRTRSIADSQSIASARSRGTSARRTPSVGASGSRSRECQCSDGWGQMITSTRSSSAHAYRSVVTRWFACLLRSWTDDQRPESSLPPRFGKWSQPSSAAHAVSSGGHEQRYQQTQARTCVSNLWD